MDSSDKNNIPIRSTNINTASSTSAARSSRINRRGILEAEERRANRNVSEQQRYNSTTSSSEAHYGASLPALSRTSLLSSTEALSEPLRSNNSGNDNRSGTAATHHRYNLATASTRSEADRERDRERRRRDREQKQLDLERRLRLETTTNSSTTTTSSSIAIPPPPSRVSKSIRPHSDSPSPPVQSNFDQAFAVVTSTIVSPPAANTATNTHTALSSSSTNADTFDSTPTRVSKRHQIFQTLETEKPSSSTNTTSTATNSRSQRSGHSAKWLELTSNAAPTHGSSTIFAPMPPVTAKTKLLSDIIVAQPNTSSIPIATATGPFSSTRPRISAVSEATFAPSRRRSSNLNAAAALLAASFADDEPSSHPQHPPTTAKDTTSLNHNIQSKEKASTASNLRWKRPTSPTLVTLSDHHQQEQIQQDHQQNVSQLQTLQLQPNHDTRDAVSTADKVPHNSWALKVRILSAVDLPPNLTPFAPLCPVVKFGLVTDPELAAECHLELKRQQATAAIKHRKETPSAPQDDECKNVLHLKEYLNSEACRKSELLRMDRLNAAVTQLGVAHMPLVHPNVRYSTGKVILSKTDNGTAEFQEEQRWDDITNPMATTLVIELSARSTPVLPDPAVPSTRSTTSRLPGYNSLTSSETSDKNANIIVSSAVKDAVMQSTRLKSLAASSNDDTASTSKSVTVEDNSLDSQFAPTSSTKNRSNNLLNQLWQRRPRVLDTSIPGEGRSATPERKAGETNETASAASAVAKFIMEGRQQLLGSTNHQQQHLSTTPTKNKSSRNKSSGSSRRRSGAHSTSLRRFENASAGWIEGGSSSEDDDEDYNSSVDTTNPTLAQTKNDANLLSESKRKGAGNSSHTSLVQPVDNNDDACWNLAEDLRVASLIIPLCRLPFDSEGKRATVSRWYSMESAGSSSVIGGIAAANLPPRAATDIASSINPSLSRSSDNTVAMTHKRSPSVLLELSFANSKDLDDSEDEVEGDDSGSLMWRDDEESENALHGTGDEWENEEGGLNKPHDIQDKEESDKKLQTATSALSASGSPKLARRKSTLERRSSNKGSCDEPFLEPGIVDYICVVGPKSIGSQRNDDGSKGWVESAPEVCVLERFPKSDEFHARNGRKYAILPNKVEWFCFPEGCKLWRGTDPPTHFDLKPRSSSSNPSHTISAFDSCLKCASSFTWFVISSTGENYGSKKVTTYGAVIRFFAPAPFCIDPTQDDYAQFHTVGNEHTNATSNNAMSSSDTVGSGCDAAEDQSNEENSSNPSATKPCSWSLKRKRLWVPLAICLTSQLPIIGILETMLLLFCETLAFRAKTSESFEELIRQVHVELANLIVNFSCPIPGVLHCSIPFLGGERLHVTQPPPAGLPPLPHGSCITAVCRLLGAEGLTTLLAAVLTECKIIIHSSDLSNLAMVAETVVGALIYPFTWALPYIPVLPEAMLEFVEAPLSYFLGLPTSVVKYIDKNVLKEAVVFDLDQAGSPDYFDGGRRDALETKRPTPLPASMSSSITKAVFRLLREEEEVEEQYHAKAGSFSGTRRTSPRLEAESLAEREFRVSVARQVCGLMRGYQECLFFVSSNQPVFNRDRFLRNAPALFEQRRGSVDPSCASGRTSTVLSPRAKRFLSLLVNTQHFHQLLERLDHDDTSFFHEVMDTFESDETITDGSTISADEAIRHLCDTLQKLEDKIPTYRVDRYDSEQRNVMGDRLIAPWESQSQSFIPALTKVEDDDDQVTDTFFHYVDQLLLPITVAKDNIVSEIGTVRGVKSLSVELLIELENNPWRYNGLLPFSRPDDLNARVILDAMQVRQKVEVKKAIGERRYRVYRLMLQQKALKHDESIAGIDPSQENSPVDLNSLLSSINEQDLVGPSTHSKRSEEQAVQDGKDRDVVRRCLERAYEGASSQTRAETQFSRRGSTGNDSQQEGLMFLENGRDLIQEAEAALRNPSAQSFLVTVLSKRARFENQRKSRQFGSSPHMLRKSRSFRKSLDRACVSRLVPAAFECLVRLCCAMLEACMETQDYDAAYTLLTHTTGFCSVKQGNNSDHTTSGDLRHDDDQESQQNQIIYMTARIGMHPIFADVRLWECVLQMHLQGRMPNNNDSTKMAADSDKSDVNEYEAAVSTLYEMVAFGVPAEELARFATRVSEARGWFSSEKGQALLLLARKLGIRRDDAGGGLAPTGSGGTLAPSPDRTKNLESFIAEREPLRDKVSNKGAGVILDVAQMEWQELSWAHPTSTMTSKSTSLSTSKRPHHFRLSQESEELASDGVLAPVGYEGRSAIASLASFGASVVATGGVDGSVFLAHTLRFSDCNSSPVDKDSTGEVRGVRVECGKDNGAVTCLAAARTAGYKQTSSQKFLDEEESFSVLEGCRIIAGTTGGALRVWCMKDIYASTNISNTSGEAIDQAMFDSRGSDRDANYVRSGQQSSANKLKWSLKGRALSGHRGGVTCLDVPSPIYRPDSLVSGGADGLIKLWSLRHSTRRSAKAGTEPPTSRFLGRAEIDRKSSSNDPQETLSGHSGRVLCIKAAWHGDRMLSGGADKTVRLWDISSAGTCLQTLYGHSCWVTHTHYWGQNNVVSASSDRSIALWDVRGGKLPLFVLRYHSSPVTDLLMGSRNDPLLVSASGDGTIVTWDFRSLSTSNDPKANSKSRVHTARTPTMKMSHCLDLSNKCSGTILLARGTCLHERSVLSASIDGRLREWDIHSGKMFDDRLTRHTDAISCLSTFTESDGLRRGNTDGAASVGGTITCSWDGTVRVKRLILKGSSER